MTDEVSNLRQVLAQTQSVERLQEAARRKGNLEQQQTARRLVDRVDIQGRQVEETPESRGEKVDPEASGKQGRDRKEPQKEAEDGEGRQLQDEKGRQLTLQFDSGEKANLLSEEDDKGRIIDLQA